MLFGQHPKQSRETGGTVSKNYSSFRRWGQARAKGSSLMISQPQASMNTKRGGWFHMAAGRRLLINHADGTTISKSRCNRVNSRICWMAELIDQTNWHCRPARIANL